LSGFYPNVARLVNREARPEGQGLAHFEELARRTGFTPVAKNAAQDWFFLELSKPAERQ